MILRFALFLSMAFGVAGLGGVVWLIMKGNPQPVVVTQIAPAPAPPPPPVQTTILVAAKAIRAGNLLKPDDITTAERPVADVPANATIASHTTRSDMVGAMMRRSLQPGDPLLSVDAMMPGDHGFLAAVLAKGMRAATVGVDAVSGSGGLIWPGDRVDLILTQTIEDQTLPIGHRLVGEAVLQDVRVVAVDQQIVRGAIAGAETQAARTITLEVTPEQAERVAVATRLGKLQVVVRSADAVSATSEAALPMKWASDVSAALAPTEQGKGPVLRVFSGVSDGKEYHFP